MDDAKRKQELARLRAEVDRLRRIETAARKMRTARERKAMAGPDLSEAIVAEQRLYQALDELDAARAVHSPVQPVVGGLDVERLRSDIEGELDGREEVADDPFNAGAIAAYHYVLSRLATTSEDQS